MTGTNGSLVIVLFRPIYPRNVGMCARAMANMGLGHLEVVDARCDLSSEEAKQGAAHAQEVLRASRAHLSLKEFAENSGGGLRIALSGRSVRAKNPEDLLATLANLTDSVGAQVNLNQDVFLLFGPEDDGLNLDELAIANRICSLPTFGDLTSMNLSHAVMLAAFLVKNSLTERRHAASSHSDPHERRLRKRIYYPTDSISEWLQLLGFNLTSPRINIEKTLNRIFLSSFPSDDELRVLDSVLQQTNRRLRAAKQD